MAYIDNFIKDYIEGIEAQVEANYRPPISKSLITELVNQYKFAKIKIKCSGFTRRDLIDKLLASDGVTVLHGLSGAGKSYVQNH